MKVLLINGSPHEFGCTYTALSEVAGALESHDIETQIFHIGNKAVHGCIACMKCRQLNQCIFEDDPCNKLSSLIREADGIVVGSPVYYAGPNGALCALLDRVFFSCGKDFAFKPAAAVSSCRRGGLTASFDRLNKYFTISRMPVVSSQYWNGVHGRTPEEVRQDAEGLQTMRTIGNNMAWLIKNIKSGNQPLPEREAVQMTNFIR